MITETGDHPLLGIGHSRHSPEGTASGSPKETAVWWMTPQHHPDTHDRNLTQEDYPVVSLLSSRLGVSKALSQSHHLVSCPVKGSNTEGTPTEWVFSFLCVLRNERFYSCRSANPATNLLIRSDPTAGRPQTVGH